VKGSRISSMISTNACECSGPFRQASAPDNGYVLRCSWFTCAFRQPSLSRFLLSGAFGYSGRPALRFM
jgi:hypothetical protein